jgi:hypothetical protein
MDLCQIDDEGRLFVSPALEDWNAVEACRVDVVIDLEGGLDGCIPTAPERCVYIYCPIFDDDEQLPGMAKLWAIARLAASLMREGHVVLSHCGMGFNRSAFVAGLILMELGMPGREAADRIRSRRPGALFNPLFAEYLESR